MTVEVVQGEDVDSCFLVVVHVGYGQFLVLGPATTLHERVVAQRIADLQARGHAIGLALDFQSESIEQAVRRARAATGYACVGTWPVRFRSVGTG